MAIHRVKEIKMKRLIKIPLMVGIIFMILTSFCSCYRYREIEYFSQKENYMNVSGIVTHFIYDRYQALYLGFSEIHLSNDITFDGQTFVDSLVTDEILHFTYSTFEIIGKNLEKVEANGVYEKIKLGDRVEFTSAPGDFGNGYKLPIVAISVNGESLLDFEEGYENFLDWLSN